jgi:hypothetical protein
VSYRVSDRAACPWRLYYTRYYTEAVISTSQSTGTRLSGPWPMSMRSAALIADIFTASATPSVLVRQIQIIRFCAPAPSVHHLDADHGACVNAPHLFAPALPRGREHIRGRALAWRRTQADHSHVPSALVGVAAPTEGFLR